MDISVKIGLTIPLGYLRQANIRVVKILDARLSDAVNFSAFRMDRLEEWWLTPSNQFAWGESDITACGCRDLNQLAGKLKNDEDYRPRLRSIQSHICAATLPERSLSDLRWNLGTRLIDGVGPVISIVCGDRMAFEAFFAEQKRMHA